MPSKDKQFLDKALIYNLEWCIRFFQALYQLGAKDLMIWFFLHIPYYNPDYRTIDKQRLIYDQMLDYMITHWSPDLNLTEHEFLFLSNQTCMPYAISYHNKNNTSILRKYSQLIRKICPWVNYYSGRLAERLLKKNTHSSTQPSTQLTTQQTTQPTKKRICFISDSFTTDTSVLRDRASVIGKLDRTKYEVYFASFYPFEAIKGIVAKVFMQRIKSNYIHLGSDLETARKELEKLDLDYIVYPDLGMKLLPTLLAYSRIAPVQLTTWGHSETSGIDTIDYYISSQWFEKDLRQAQQHYSEKLILMSSLGTFYISPHTLFVTNNPDYQADKKRFKTKEEWGFAPDVHLYACLQTFYKMSPEFEECLARIIELDPQCVILLSNTFPYCKNHLERLRKTMGDEKIKRLRWFGSLEKDEFLNLVSISDVCLDPFPFGGCNTSFDAFDYNIPVITMPSEFLHGRFTYGLYRKMGLDECIVSTTEEYAQLAARIGINEKLRHKINRNIEMKKNMVFQEQASIDEWNGLFENLKDCI
jgi:predicted O-linked N-acetylglucosamine transferase (SPINDLY family)